MSFEPKIIGFLCNWCSYTGADLAGTSRMKYPPNMVGIRVMCSGRVDPGFILSAFQKGADGVIVCGCHPGDCHYVEGNYKCMRRMPLTKRIIKEFGIDENRLRLEWISASEGAIFQEVITEFTNQIREMGPLALKELNYQPDEIADKVASEMGDITHV
ncbi:MAG: methyl-viologen-reducing hydrogenase subunit delta [Candidatus Zixiibacteriota bacterium]|nr:MAG: methyl-viologen-reducing hydrogenase subunit delta [candidate division Zixibacteria bacterium]